MFSMLKNVLINSPRKDSGDRMIISIFLIMSAKSPPI